MTEFDFEHFDPYNLSAREVDEFFSTADDEDIEAVLFALEQEKTL